MASLLKAVLPGAALSKANPSAGFKQQMLKPVPLVDGLCVPRNSLAHFIHGPSKCTKYQEKPGAPIARAVFSVESSFLSGKFPGNMEHDITSDTKLFFVRSVVCVNLSLSVLPSPHSGSEVTSSNTQGEQGPI